MIFKDTTMDINVVWGAGLAICKSYHTQNKRPDHRLPVNSGAEF